ncbi:MAG TPA: hypothetical protein VG102_00200 [Candidatus Paceibacterota bacterium]|jgi:hypothetical protein|nr:hypothetical protein [Candidatus Paceibacterota bacterium]
MSAKTGYNVALRYTTDAGGYAGVVTWTSFPSKAEFDGWFEAGGNREQEVVEEGITEDRAIELCRTTPLRSYVAAAIDESTNPATGVVDHGRVKVRLQEVRLAFEARALDLLTNR